MIRLAVLSLALFGSSASAHETWLRVVPGSAAGPLVYDLTSGEAFPNADYAIKPDRIAASGWRDAQGDHVLRAGPRGAHVLRLRADQPAAGAALAWVTLKPKLLTLATDKIEPYFAEIDASKRLREDWSRRPEPKQWRERYVKYAKTLHAAVDASANDRTAWADPAGLDLEILALVDPLRLAPGAALPAEVRSGGKPLAGFRLGLMRGGEAKVQFETTDDAGRARFTLDGCGDWLLQGTDLQAANEPDLEWTSRFTTLSFDNRSAPGCKAGAMRR